MEPAEKIVEVREKKGDGRSKEEKFDERVALVIAVMAMLLAITSLGGGNAAEDIMNHNIHASDTWAFYQAKSIRQTSNKLAADALEAELQINRDSLSPEVRAGLEQRIEEYRQTVTRYEDEPDRSDPQNPLKGEGRKQLAAKARDFETQRDRAQKQDPNFDFAEALFQIAIVLASVSILADSRMILKVSLGVGFAATLLMLNGYFLFLDLPF
jgi:hypothetical protein